MSQGDAQAALVAVAVLSGWVIVMAHANGYRPNRWWWLVPLFFLLPAFITVYLKAVLG
jgi:hypothetical protein